MLKKRVKWVHPLEGRRIKEVIAEVFDVWENDVWQNNSPWEHLVGGCTWGVSGSSLSTWISSGHYHDLHCFGTMKDCLRFGFTIDHEDHSITPNCHPRVCDKCLEDKDIMEMSYERREEGLCKKCAGETEGTNQ
jgi:hypothetical protein